MNRLKAVAAKFSADIESDSMQVRFLLLAEKGEKVLRFYETTINKMDLHLRVDNMVADFEADIETAKAAVSGEKGLRGDSAVASGAMEGVKHGFRSVVEMK